MADKSEKDKDKDGKKGKSSKLKKLLVVLAVLFGLAGSSAGAYMFLNKPDVEPGKKYLIETETLDMGEVLVNLTTNGGIRYLKVKIILEYPKNKKLGEELKKKNHVLSDIIITTLRKKTLTEVYNASAVQGLKDELIKEINGNLDYGDITGIYFTDFLVQ